MASEDNPGIDVAAFYDRYASMVHRRCLRLLGDEESARDAVQEVFVKVLRHQERLHGAYPSSLLFQIATTTCLNVIRERRLKGTVGDEAVLAAIAGPGDPERHALNGLWLRQIFGGEADSTRLLAVRHFVDGLTLQQTADEAGLSLSGVRKRLAKLQAKVETLRSEADEA